jgi:quercetin dioxygenase-like cupin family protein
MGRLLITAALLTALGATTAALAAGASPITEKVLGGAGIAQRYRIDVAKPADVVVAQATVPPGASFGWHYHRAAVVVVVESGTLTLYDSADRSCTPQRYPAGEGFAERPHHVHLARNEGRTPAVVLVTYLGLKHGVSPDVPSPSPGTAPSSQPSEPRHKLRHLPKGSPAPDAALGRIDQPAFQQQRR